MKSVLWLGRRPVCRVVCSTAWVMVSPVWETEVMIMTMQRIWAHFSFTCSYILGESDRWIAIWVCGQSLCKCQKREVWMWKIKCARSPGPSITLGQTCKNQLQCLQGVAFASFYSCIFQMEIWVFRKTCLCLQFFLERRVFISAFFLSLIENSLVKRRLAPKHETSALMPLAPRSPSTWAPHAKDAWQESVTGRGTPLGPESGLLSNTWKWI